MVSFFPCLRPNILQMADQPNVDGVTLQAATSVPPEVMAVRQWKKRLIVVGGTVYVLFVVWAFFLLMSLPAEGLGVVAAVGALTMALAAISFLGIAVVGLLRIGRGPLPPAVRRRSMIVLLIIITPGLLISIVVPFFILRSPPLPITIVSPSTPEEFVAPVQVTFGLDRAIAVLAEDGFRPIQYTWDITGDGKTDQETVTPQLTATYDREGVYVVRVAMIDAAGGARQAVRRFVIQQSVISILPRPVLLNRPAVLSLAHLIRDPQSLVEVQWDFDNDGRTDQTTKDPQTTYTFFRVGRATVAAVLVLQNKTQARYERSFEVREPPPLPFPVTLVSEPKFLISPSPFPTLWRVESREDIAQVLWDFGDGERGEGKRIAHTFAQRGTFVVEAKVFARSGSSAQLSRIVQVVEQLQLPDLTFEGTPDVQGDRITGQVPLVLDIKPRTSMPFVQFSWEAPDATEVGSTEGAVQAIYRREGNYRVTLVARDAENHVLRRTITVEVKPPESVLSFRMDPETGIAPLPVLFDASETFIPGQTITGFEWEFGDSTSPRVGGARIAHRYEEEGTYTISLTVRTTSGEQFRTNRTIAVRAAQLVSCLLPSRTSGQAPLGVQFTSSCSTGTVTKRLWDFGDGAQSDEAEPIHVFEEPGQYTVTLTVEDATGRTHEQSVTITVKP